MNWARIRPSLLLSLAGSFTWLCVGLPLLWEVALPAAEDGLGAGRMLGWGVSHAVFGGAFVFLSLRLGRPVRTGLDRAALALLTASALGVSHFSQSGLGGILLMVVAGVLPWVLAVRSGIAWMLLQHAALVPVFALGQTFPWWGALFQALLYVGYSSFVFVTSLVARQQARDGDALRRLNAELRATRVLLAESSRANERVRIARELHDLLGHHLTALSLNLEVASHLASGRARELVSQAQSLARLLLADVREAVSQLRDRDGVDVAGALRALVEGLPGMEVELIVPETLAATDPDRAQILLRCAQEAVTNTVRHAAARRLRLEVRPEPGGLRLQARDDGRGCEAVQVGNGLRGMQERLQDRGGWLRFETAPGRGFQLEAWLPDAEADRREERKR
ncbi:MAG: two-component sensor histidine kinase [Lysobacteraceae bacterium]|nr:MAG: two-component sensor histidine kinase [Xanthomonadaceae bacterium]